MKKIIIVKQPVKNEYILKIFLMEYQRNSKNIEIIFFKLARKEILIISYLSLNRKKPIKHTMILKIEIMPNQFVFKPDSKNNDKSKLNRSIPSVLLILFFHLRYISLLLIEVSYFVEGGSISLYPVSSCHREIELSTNEESMLLCSPKSKAKIVINKIAKELTPTITNIF